MKLRKYIIGSIVLVLGAGITVSFQNCEDVQFTSIPTATVDPNDPGQGGLDQDLPRDIPEIRDEDGNLICEEGKHFGIWLDENDDGSIENEKFLGSIVPYQGDKSAAENYNYYSASAHPYIGPKPDEFSSHVFFYEGSDGLTFNFYFNIDEGGSPDNIVNWDMETIGNSKKDDVLLSDDANELKRSAETQEGHQYEGRFHYWDNTDGGIIGPFEGEDFYIKVNVLETGDIQDATFYSEGDRKFSLNNANNKVSSFIIGFLGYKKCKKQ
ncbi:MAG: hypothetical protein H6626_13820 [Pseudobdellovibrionaceae bacterium]|nr:hypothetical protein [Bdellovibrionales bacterium]USN47248.1 MAG: hypothetical protein H6626_13820 [Pseudobdellovibrionaceae bacterium]